jgi:AcrR family transcriptional regulator
MADPAPTRQRRRRRDFEESRDLILDAASEAFARRGLGVSMKEIAADAEVASATLYRHFPSKDALVRAACKRRVLDYVAVIEQAQASDDPTAAFRGTIHEIVRLQADDRFFREFVGELEDPFEDDLLVGFFLPLAAAIERASKADVLRPQVELVDILVLLTATEMVSRPINAVSPDGLHRMLDFMLDGVCVEDVVPGSGAMTHQQLFEVVKS